MRPGSALAVRDLSVSHGRVQALDGVSLDVPANGFTVLLGPSGCGKSTLLAAIAGLLPVRRGRVLLGGRDITADEPGARDIAVVFQSLALYPAMTARDNIGFGMRMRGATRAEATGRVDAVARLLRIDDVLDRRPAQLSGGQRQRVAIGRALVRDPALFLFDEPLSSLDAKLRAEMRAEIRLLHERLGTTCLLVTHDQTEAMAMASHIAVMQAGRILQAGLPQEVYDRPANLFVAGFVGSPGMNLVPGRLAPRDGTVAFEAPGLVVRLDRYAWLEPPSDRPAVLGFRPEDIGVARDGRAPVVELPPVLVEPTGPDTLVHLRLGGTAITARLHRDERVAVGQPCAFAFDLSRACVFCPQTGLRL